MPPQIKIGPLTFDRPVELSDTIKALRALDYQGVGFKPESAANGGVRFYLSGGEPISSGGSQYSVLPLLDDSPVRFWFGIDLYFTPSGRSASLDQIGILVRGGTLATDTRDVFRAEWEPRSSQRHAQPHWHVYGSRLIEMFRAGADESTVTLNIHRFHFAMSARWMDEDDKSGTKHSIQSTEGSVKRWIEATLKYSKEQLKYIAKHVAKS